MIEVSSISAISSVDNRQDQWSPLAKGIYTCAGNAGWSLLELGWRLQIEPDLLENAYVGVRILDGLVDYTGYSLLNIRRIGLGLDPIKPIATAE